MSEISTRTKSSKTTLLGGARQGVKKPFFSKKCIFWPENDVFSKKSFYKKLISDQNYIMCTCQKKDFLNKVMRLQFSPDSTYLCPTPLGKSPVITLGKIAFRLILMSVLVTAHCTCVEGSV